jgi:hypothetical protein
MPAATRMMARYLSKAMAKDDTDPCVALTGN